MLGVSENTLFEISTLFVEKCHQMVLTVLKHRITDPDLMACVKLAIVCFKFLIHGKLLSVLVMFSLKRDHRCTPSTITHTVHILLAATNMSMQSCINK